MTNALVQLNFETCPLQEFLFRIKLYCVNRRRKLEIAKLEKAKT